MPLESLGAKCSSNNGNPPISVSGRIKGGEIQIPGNISSQFISALMITAPKLENGIILNIQDKLVSKPYVDATITTMNKFGVNVETVIPYQKYASYLHKVTSQQLSQYHLIFLAFHYYCQQLYYSEKVLQYK